ncbi:hypothetical protein Q7P37_008263 [Cladosporium fusiforme]
MAAPASSSGVIYPNPVDEKHQGPKVTVTAALCLCYASIILATRLLIRWPWRKLFGLDDAAATIASIFALAQWTIIIHAASLGLGTASEMVPEEVALEVKKLIFVSEVFYVFALFWSKLSVCLFFRRLSASTKNPMLADILTCACAALGLISVFISGLREQVLEPWVQGPVIGHSTLHRWIALETFAVAIDLVIVAFPFKLIWGLQMQVRMKCWVLLGFIIRLPLIPIAIMRLQSLNISLTSDEYLFDAATTEYYTQAEMTFSLIAATIPCLRVFMEAAKTGLLGVSMWEVGTTTNSYTRSHGGKETSTLSRTKGPLSKSPEETESIELFQRVGGSNTAHARATSDRVSVGSDSSETAIIVRKTVNVRYE